MHAPRTGGTRALLTLALALALSPAVASAQLDAGAGRAATTPRGPRDAAVGARAPRPSPAAPARDAGASSAPAATPRAPGAPPPARSGVRAPAPATPSARRQGGAAVRGRSAAALPAPPEPAQSTTADEASASPSAAPDAVAAAPAAVEADLSTPAPPAAPVEEEPPAAPAPPAEPALRLSPILQARTRAEIRVAPYEYAAGAPQTGDDSVEVLTRVRAGVEAVHERVKIVASAQDVRRMGEVPPGTTDGSFTTMHEGYLQISDDATWARLGRQEIALGDQRLIGVRDWSMAGRSFDAFRLHVEVDQTTIDAFGSLVRMRGTVTAADGTQAESDGDYLAGAQAAWNASDAFSVDFYLLYRSDGATDADLLRDRLVVAPGFRAYGALGERVGYSYEMVFQAGEVRSAARARHRHQALGLAGELRFQPHDTATTFVGGSFATGDSLGTSWTELDNFYPTNRRPYGYADLIGWRNMREGYAKLELRAPSAPVKGLMAYHVFAQANGEARWSDAAGRTLGVSTTPGSNVLGSEVDATLRWEPIAQLFVELGYAVFLPAAGAARLGHPDPTQLIYLFVGGKLP